MTRLQLEDSYRVFAHWGRIVCSFLLFVFVVPAYSESKFRDPLDTPAQMRTAVTERPLMAVTHAGSRLVAVGSRGLIIISDDQGKIWTQASVPVQSDLLAVQFPTAQEGWVVGHDGIILHSADAGKTWVKQLDGRMAADIFKAYYKKGDANSENSNALKQLEANYKAGPALPFLDVWFEDTQKGFVVGSFGMIAATSDGGKTWEPWLHRMDNSQYLNLNAIRGIGNNIYIVGEKGQVYQLDRSLGRFTHTDTGYIGSFFGATGNSEALVAYGLRGVAYRSGDGGKRWEALTMPNEQTISEGIPSSNGEGFILVNVAGEFLRGDKLGKEFHVLSAGKSRRMTGIAALPMGGYAVTGLDGVKIETPHDVAVPGR